MSLYIILNLITNFNLIFHNCPCYCIELTTNCPSKKKIFLTRALNIQKSKD